jgi:hypothetical protein
MDDTRKSRLAVNETVFREMNEQIDGRRRAASGDIDGMLRIVCECGEASCTQFIPVHIEEYEQIRSNPVLFIVVPGHERSEVEIRVHRTADYDIVRKRRGDPERIARATDPRS